MLWQNKQKKNLLFFFFSTITETDSVIWVYQNKKPHLKYSPMLSSLSSRPWSFIDPVNLSINSKSSSSTTWVFNTSSQNSNANCRCWKKITDSSLSKHFLFYPFTNQRNGIIIMKMHKTNKNQNHRNMIQ